MLWRWVLRYRAAAYRRAALAELDAIVAGTAYGLNGTTTNSNTAVLNEGDAIKLQYVKNGSGSTFAGPMVVTLFGISYTSIGTA